MKKENITNLMVAYLILPFFPIILEFSSIAILNNNIIQVVIALFQQSILLIYILIMDIKKSNTQTIFLFSIITLIVVESLIFIFSNSRTELDMFLTYFNIINLTLMMIIVNDETFVFDNDIFSRSVNFMIVISYFFIGDVKNNVFSLFRVKTLSHSLGVSSFFTNRNSYGQFLFVFKSLVHLTNKKSKITQFVQITSFIILLLTLSRTSILSYLIFLFLKERRIEKRYIFIFSGFIILYLLVPEIKNIFDTYLFRKQAGTSGRTKIWSLALFNIKQNMITGIGEVGTKTLIRNNFLNLNEVHNSYLSNFLNWGAFSGSLRVIILCLAINRVYQLVYFPYQRQYFALLVGVLVYGMFESITLFYPGHVSTLFTSLLILFPSKIIKIKNKDDTK